MKISSKISIVFSILSSFVILMFGLIVYQLEKSHTLTDFSSQLKQRVNTTEQFFLEKDAYSESEFEKIKTNFTQKLNNEIEEVIDVTASTPPKFENQYSNDLKQALLNNDTYSFTVDNRQGESKKFNVKGRSYLIIVSAIDKVGQQNLKFLLKVIITLTIIAIPLIFIFGFAYSKNALKPIRKKIDKANRISASNLDERLRVINPNDELGQLATAFNHLLDRLETSFQTQKSFIANASHEIKNPLTAIMGEAEIALNKTRSAEEYIETLHIILSESERLNLTVNNLLQLSKIASNEEHIKYESTIFYHFIKTTVESYHFINPKSNIQFTHSLTKEQISFKSIINTSLLKTAILNIVDNACKFSNNQIVTIQLYVNKQHFVLSIKDKGIGIPKEEINQILQPFYRASNTLKVQGSGIGLALSAKIIKLHQGEISINSQINTGTEVLIKIPIDSKAE